MTELGQVIRLLEAPTSNERARALIDDAVAGAGSS
jgi:hypothetical protein